MITVTDLSLRFGAEPLFSPLTATFNLGRFVTILGPSGCGKSSLLAAVAGHLSPASGRVNTDPHARIAWAQQNSPVLPRRSVLDNITLGGLCLGEPERHSRATATRWLHELGLHEMTHRLAGSLSGGERQRLALARALSSRANVILADEPTASLDFDNRQLVIDSLCHAAASGACVIVATHDPAVAQAAADHIDLDALRMHH